MAKDDSTSRSGPARKVELPAPGVDGAETPAYVAPADATVEDLAAMADDARAQANALLEGEQDPATWADRLERAEQFIGAIDAIEARSGELVAEQAETQAREDEIRQRLAPKNEPAAETSDAPELDEDGNPKVTTPAAPDAVSAAVADGAPADGVPALVAAGATTLHPVRDLAITPPARRSAVAAAAAGGAPAAVPTTYEGTGSTYLVAAANVKGSNAGDTMTWGAAGVAAESRFSALPHPRPGTTNNAGRTQLSIGQVHTELADTLLLADGKGTSGDFADADEAIEYAVSRARRAEATGTDGSLVAAGGWCAPSETLYDLLDITTDDGMLDVPGIIVTRGGVRYSLGPDFTAVYVTNNANFTRTEAQAIAGTPPKPMINIPCPSFTDNRMVVDGLYLTGDILSSKGYPEAYADYMQKALKAFAHYVNAASIADQVALSTAVDLSQSIGTAPASNRTLSAVTEVLGGVELQITDMRYRNRLSMTQAVEIIAPFWIKGVLRTDMAKRVGVNDPQKISDADMTEWFTLRGATIQYVYDWQDAFSGVTAGFGAGTAIQAWPLTVKLLMYPEGSFVRALDPVIELNAVYDSVLLQTNQYVALFMEQGRLTLKRHWDTRVVTFDIRAYGSTTAGIPAGAAGQTLTGSTL